MRIIHRSNSSFFSFLFRFYEPINRNEAHRARSKMYLFYLAIDIVVPEPIVENHRLEISAWKIGERASECWKWSVEKTGVRQPGYRRSVHCAIGEAAKLSWEKGHAEFRDSCLFYLKKISIPFFPSPFLFSPNKSWGRPLFPSLSQFKPTFKIFSKEEKKPAPFLLVLRVSLYAFLLLSPVWHLSRKNKWNGANLSLLFFFSLSLPSNDFQSWECRLREQIVIDFYRVFIERCHVLKVRFNFVIARLFFLSIAFHFFSRRKNGWFPFFRKGNRESLEKLGIKLVVKFERSKSTEHKFENTFGRSKRVSRRLYHFAFFFLWLLCVSSSTIHAQYVQFGLVCHHG